MSKLIIASGAYVESELAAEFGPIPPAFLPLGSMPLFWHQARNLACENQGSVITIPESFKVSESEEKIAQGLQLDIVRTPDHANLAEALLSLARQGLLQKRIDILFGDTLFQRPPSCGTDWIAIGETAHNYKWELDHASSTGLPQVWAGMFSFSDADEFVRALEATNDFIGAVKLYEKGKPLSRIKTSDWLDFGHVHSFYTSKRISTTQRHFNSLEISKSHVTKKSSNVDKMAAEALWYKELPMQLRPFTPNFCGDIVNASGDVVGYRTEYLSLPTLSEIFTFGRLPRAAWSVILDAIDEFLDAEFASDGRNTNPSAIIKQLYQSKTQERLLELEKNPIPGLDIKRRLILNNVELPSIQEMAEEAVSHVMKGNGRVLSDIHGDLCFSNILFDFRSSRIKVIDPRGRFKSGHAAAGDLRYEIGKLAHSAVGLYDLIIANRYSLSGDGNDFAFKIDNAYQQHLTEVFLRRRFLGVQLSEWDVFPIMIILFISMLPLHADNSIKQTALALNAARLFSDWRSQ